LCYASNYVVGVGLGHCTNKKPYVSYYVSHILNDAQMNYIRTKKEFLLVVFAFEKFRPYLIGSHVIVFTNHYVLKHLFSRTDDKPMLLRWMLLLQEFDYQIINRKGSENPVANHLSRIVCDRSTKTPISKCFPDDHLFVV